MVWILIVGISMAVASAIFWCIEFVPFIRAMKGLKKPSSNNPLKCVAESMQYITGFIGAVFTLWRLALDIGCTVWLSYSFGFSGTTGGIIGISISNVISVFLLFQGRFSNESEYM